MTAQVIADCVEFLKQADAADLATSIADLAAQADFAAGIEARELGADLLVIRRRGKRGWNQHGGWPRRGAGGRGSLGQWDRRGIRRRRGYGLGQWRDRNPGSAGGRGGC